MASNGFSDEMPECPLCLEPLGLDDINFYPCACRYQICRFCWHRIRTDENGLCPHCREIYPENPAEYTPPTAEQLAKLKTEKKQKEVNKRQKVVESREKLALVRVVQRNLVFVIGLSPRLADPEVLKRNEYFGKYGKIYKVVINNHTIYNGAQGPSVSAYVTYCRNEDASKAIAAVNNAFIDGRSLKASFGTTKYCTSFLKGTLCTKPDCMYLHELGEDEASFTKEDMQLGKHQMFENATLASLLPTGGGEGSGKETTPTVAAEGGVKIKHTILPRPKDNCQADLAESALPATAHWASNQKSSDSPTPQQDQSHSHPKQSDSSSNHSSGKQGSLKSAPGSSKGARGMGMEHSSNSHSRHAGSGKRGAKDVAGSQKHETGEETLKSNSRPGSVSPNTQKSAHSRTLEPVKRTAGGGGGGRESAGRTINHSRGSSLTKSLTPNLSPHSTLSASSSSGSLRQEAEGTTTTSVTNPASAGGGGAMGAELKAAPEAEAEEGTDGVRATSTGSISSREESSLSAESEFSNASSNVVLEQLEAVHLTKSNGQVPASQQMSVSHSRPDLTTQTQPPPPANGNFNTSLLSGGSIPSPPGLSKSRSQPLPVSKQSEVVCRQLDLGAGQKPSPLLARSESLGVGSQTGMPSQQLLSRDGRDGGMVMSEAQGSEQQRRTGLMVPATSLSSDVLTSLTSGGSSHFGGLGVNWGLSPAAVPSNPFPRVFPAASLTAFPSSLPVTATIASHHPFTLPTASQPPHAHTTTNTNPLPKSTSAGHHAPSPLLPTPTAAGVTPLMDNQSRKVDDGDDLGFDPWDVSQQGLADLMETEAEQKQNRPHLQSHPPLGGMGGGGGAPAPPPSSSLSSGSTSIGKKVPNGITSPFLNHHHHHHQHQHQPQQPQQQQQHPVLSSLYKHWQQGGLPPSSSSGGVAGGGGGGSGSESVQDEFRALFPNVNISFGGGKSKAEASPLVQALDGSNPVPPSLPAYHPTHLATAINFTYPTPLQGGMATSRGHTHLASATAGSKGMHPSSLSQQQQQQQQQSSDGAAGISMSNLSNQFLGQSQPGFPASCFRVKGHDGGGISGGGSSSSASTATPTTTSSESLSTNSYNNCLGADWPDLGITLGQPSKAQTKVELGAAVGQGKVLPRPPVPAPELGGVGTGLAAPQNSKVAATIGPDLGGTASMGATQLVAAGSEVGTAGAKTQGKTTVAMTTTGAAAVMSESDSASGLWKASGTVTSSSGSVPVSSVPPPPPGFTKPLQMDGTAPSTTPTAVGAGGSGGSQPATTANSVKPMLFTNSKGQAIPAHIIQSWNQLRSFASLTPAQQQQLLAARASTAAAATSQLTFQQQQQLLAQQYLFQQALLLRSPMLQARMAQQLQQAALLQKQQQQQALLAAGLSAGSTTASTSVVTSRGNPVSMVASSGIQGTSKLLVSMAGAGNSGGIGGGGGQTVPPSNLAPASVVTGPAVVVTQASGCSTARVNSSPATTISSSSSKPVAGSKSSRQNIGGGGGGGGGGGSGGVKGQSGGGRSSGGQGGGSGVTRGGGGGGGISSGHSKGSSQVSGGSGSGHGSLNSRGGGEKHHHASSSRNSKNSSRPKNGGSGHHSAASSNSSSDRKPRQKSSK